QPDIKQDDRRLEPRAGFDGGGHRAGFADDLDPGLGAKERAQAHADDLAIVDQHQANTFFCGSFHRGWGCSGIVRTTRVPLPGWLSTLTVAPTRPARIC